MEDEIMVVLECADLATLFRLDTPSSPLFWYMLLLVFIPTTFLILWGFKRGSGRRQPYVPLLGKKNYIIPTLIIIAFQLLMLIFYPMIVEGICNL